MLTEIPYDRRAAVRYAMMWAFARNPKYYDFEHIGGDCTNFASQCLYAGCGIMNYTDTFGWFYKTLSDRSPSWTGVSYLRDFLLNNAESGVYGEKRPLELLLPGDTIQLTDSGGITYHSAIISYIMPPGTPDRIFVCAHSFDARNRRLSSYSYAAAEGIHILGARRFSP